MHIKWKAYLLFACFLWAISFVATKVALESTPPLSVAVLRVVVAGALFLIWFVIQKRKPKLARLRDWGGLFFLSLVGMGHYAVQTTGLQYTAASNASLYTVTGPISILILGAIFLRERLSLRKIFGVLISLVGVLTVMGMEKLLAFEFQQSLWGDFLVLVSIFMWAVFTVFGKKQTDQMGAFSLLGVACIMGAIWMLPVGWWELVTTERTLSEIQVGSWLAIAFLGLGCTFLANLLWLMALKHSESQKVGVYLYTIPPMTAVIAAFYLGEPIGLNLLLGGALVFAGVYLTDAKPKRVQL